MRSFTQLGSRTTGEEALRGAALSGKTAVVTGGNAGLGVETVRVLANAGAKVISACRDVQSGEKVADALRASGLKVRLSLSSARGGCSKTHGSTFHTGKIYNCVSCCLELILIIKTVFLVLV